MPTITPQQFVNKWRNIELKESAAAQQHFIDLCRLINHPTITDDQILANLLALNLERAKKQSLQSP